MVLWTRFLERNVVLASRKVVYCVHNPLPFYKQPCRSDVCGCLTSPDLTPFGFNVTAKTNNLFESWRRRRIIPFVHLEHRQQCIISSPINQEARLYIHPTKAQLVRTRPAMCKSIHTTMGKWRRKHFVPAKLVGGGVESV